MKEYLTKIKGICDLLNASVHTVSDDKQIDIILAGLSVEFESVLTVSHLRLSYFVWIDLSTCFLSVKLDRNSSPPRFLFR